MVAIESACARPDARRAVSALAEARIRSSAPAPRLLAAQRDRRRAGTSEEGRASFQGGNAGSAVFASRAQRIADSLSEEARRASSAKGTRVTTVPRVNLRAGPSTRDPVLAVLQEATPLLLQRSEGEWVLVRTPDGAAGWVHASLIAND
jgi:hypothetical protein